MRCGAVQFSHYSHIPMVWFGTDFSLYGAMQCGFVLSKISRCGSVRGFYSQESYGAVQLPVEQLLPTVRSRAQR